MQITKRLSPEGHFGERKGADAPSLLILHYTETKDLAEAEDYFLGRADHPFGDKVSAHYMVDVNGAIYQYVEEDRRAHHAGVSYWGGIKDVNSHSIGIEIVNPGHKYGYQPFPIQQMDSVAKLCKDILARYPAITPDRVVGHSDIAPQRKRDPGELFDWRNLARRGIGLWPDPEDEDFAKASACLNSDTRLRQTFAAYGYNPDEPLPALITAFQRHFYPEIFRTPERVGVADTEMAARLCSLVRMKNDLNG